MKKVVVFVTASQANSVREAIGRVGQGRLGNYAESTHTSLAGFGQRAIDEERIEFACDDATFAAVVSAIDDTAPLFTPTIDSWNMEVLES